MGKLRYLIALRLRLHFRRTMIAGVLLLVPIVITYIVLRFVFDFMDGVLKPGIEGAFGKSFPGLGIITLLVLVYVAGLLWDQALGRRLLRMGQESLLSLPVVGAVYRPAMQLINSFSSNGASGFKRVVAIEYPRPQTWAIGFLTAMTTDENDRSMGIVYIPTAPTPNSGWVAMLPVEDIYDTDLTVQQAMSMVLSGGIAAPARINKAILKEQVNV